MTDNTIGYAVLQIIPSLKGVSEAIEKQISGQVVEVKVEPKWPKKGSTEDKKLDKDISDSVKKKPVEVPVTPKVDQKQLDKELAAAREKILKGAKDWDSFNKATAEKWAKSQEALKNSAKNAGKQIGTELSNGVDAKTIGVTVGTAIGEGIKNAPAVRGIGTKLRDAITGGLRELNNNPTLQAIPEQLGQQVGAAIGQKIGQALHDSPLGQAAQTVAETVQTVTGSLAAIRQGDAAGGLNGIADALGRIGQTGAATKLHEVATEVQPLQEKFGSLKGNIEGSTNGLLGLTNNSGKIAGGLNAIAGAAGPLAAVFVALDNLMPGFDQHLQNIMRDGGNFKDWVNTLFPGTNLIDKWGKGWINPGGTPALPNSPIGPNGQPRPGLIPGGGQAPTVGGIPIPGLVPAGPSGGAGTVPRPGASGFADRGTLGSSWLDGIIGPGTGDPVVPGGRAPSGFVNGGVGAPSLPAGLPIAQLTPGKWDDIDAVARSFHLTAGSRFRDPNGPTIAGVPASRSYHGSGRATDYNGTPEQRLAFAQYMATNYGSQLKELIYSAPGFNSTINNGRVVGPFGSFYTLAQAGDHSDHVHIAYDEGGAVPDDVKAYLHRGEHVLPKDDVEAMGGQEGVYEFRNELTSGGFSLPSSFGDIAGFGLKGLGQGIGTTKSGSDLSLFGNAAASAVSGQVSSALGTFGIPGAPRWLQGISNFVSGISIGGVGGGGGGGGPQTIFNIQTARVEDAFIQADRLAKVKALSKLEHI